ncbi:MAG: hypothetical protein LAO20_08865 [Acidobacteriia bacterium]|nr:hypothetical protein [Terriglobia bacterium]
MKSSHPELSAALTDLTAELRRIDASLKSEQAPDDGVLREFRRVLDDVRLTAWTVNELMTVRKSGKDPQPMLSFLASERLRRLARMMKDVSADMDHGLFTWDTSGIQNLADSVNLVQAGLSILILRHRERFQKVGEGGR